MYDNNNSIFSLAQTIEAADEGQFVWDFDLGLLNGDNYADFAVLVSDEGSGETILKCFANDQQGLFSPNSYFTLDLHQSPNWLVPAANQIAVGEYNYDGLPEIAVVGENRTVIFENQSDTFNADPIWESDYYFSFLGEHYELKFADLHGFGGMSLIVAGGYSDWAGSGGKLSVFRYEGDAPPCPPKNFHITEDANNNPVLHWEFNTEDDIFKYRVYRNISSPEYPPIEGWEKLATCDEDENYYTDTEVYLHQGEWNARIWYFVTAVDEGDTPADSLESDPSETLSFGALYQPESQGEGSVASTTETNSFSLSASPNPFNNQTTLKLGIPEACNVEVKLYDVAGKEAADIYSGFIGAGVQHFTIDAGQLSSGIYFCRAVAGGEVSVVKLMLIK